MLYSLKALALSSLLACPISGMRGFEPDDQVPDRETDGETTPTVTPNISVPSTPESRGPMWVPDEDDFRRILPVEERNKLLDEDYLNGYGTFSGFSEGSVKRALLVTLTYMGQSGALHGPIHDAWAMKRFLERQGYEVVWLKDFTVVAPEVEKFVYGNLETLDALRQSGNIYMERLIYRTVQAFENNNFPDSIDCYKAINPKTMNGKEANYYCSKSNIEKYMKELAQKTTSGDNVFFYYSGHGGRMFKTNVIDAPDNSKNIFNPFRNSIKDEFIHDKLVAKLPAGSNAILMFDACHSGRMANLRYRARPDGSYKTHSKKRTWPKANVISISGCDDNETSLDGKVGGQLTRAFLNITGFSYEDVIDGMIIKRETDYREYLENVYEKLTMRELLRQLRDMVQKWSDKSATPQIECSEPYDMDKNTVGLFMGIPNEYMALNTAGVHRPANRTMMRLASSD